MWRVIGSTESDYVPQLKEPIQHVPKQKKRKVEKEKKDYADYWQKHEQDYTTPEYLYHSLNKEFQFDWDAAATPENTKCSNYWTKEDDALVQDWNGKRIFCNPPWKHLSKWVEKAASAQNSLVVLLIPASVGTKYFHRWIWDGLAHHPRPGVQLRFIEGRLTFGNFTQVYNKDTMLIVFCSLPQP